MQMYLFICVFIYFKHCGSNQGTCFSLWLVRVAARMSAATRQWAPKSAGQLMADDESAMLEMETEKEKEKRQLTPAKTPDREAKKQNIAKEEAHDQMEKPEGGEKQDLNIELAILRDDLQNVHSKLNTQGN